MNRSFLSAVQAIGLVIVSFVVAPFVSADDSVKKTKSVVARTLSLTVPAHWDQVKATSTMRAAQFRIPQKGADGPAADLVVFYFGGPTGGVKANVERWVGQFSKEDRKIEMTQAKCEAGSCIIVDAIGTWNKPDGPPFARKTVKTPGSRVINIIVIENGTERGLLLLEALWTERSRHRRSRCFEQSDWRSGKDGEAVRSERCPQLEFRHRYTNYSLIVG